MEKADSDRRVSLASAIMDCRKARMHLLCEELMPGYLNGITGEYAPPAGYLVNEKEAEAFDRDFRIWRRKNFQDRFSKMFSNLHQIFIFFC